MIIRRTLPIPLSGIYILSCELFIVIINILIILMFLLLLQLFFLQWLFDFLEMKTRMGVVSGGDLPTDVVLYCGAVLRAHCHRHFVCATPTWLKIVVVLVALHFYFCCGLHFAHYIITTAYLFILDV